MKLSLKHILCLIFGVAGFFPTFSQEKRGADIPWITYEAENMQTNGNALTSDYVPYHVATESSGGKCVRLTGNDKYVAFYAKATANTMVIRYCLPDDKKGNGTHSFLRIYKNGEVIGHYGISSQYCMLYGSYPFTNNPKAGKARDFYDEIRIKNIRIAKGDIIRIQLDAEEKDAKTCVLDLVDLENISLPLNMPSNAISLLDKRFGTANDYTDALRKCIVIAEQTGKTVWIPAGSYQIIGDIHVPEGVTIQGAGMWYTTLIGNSEKYSHEDKRIRIIGEGDNIHLSDFAIIGALNYRSDKEANDGIVGTFGINSSIKNIWIEHTKVGMWIENSSHLVVQGCRIRNTIADGINFCVGMNHSAIRNCTARNTGDDCFAVWPTINAPQKFHPEKILIRNCTGQLPFLANGVAIYGGESNEIRDCSFSDISVGSAILISTTFPTEDKYIHNNFQGKTIVENCDITRSGGFDHDWGWRGAVEICLDKHNISGIVLRNLKIDSSISNAINIIARNLPGNIGRLSDASFGGITISKYGIGVKKGYALYISDSAHGELKINRLEFQTIKNEAKGLSLTQ